MENPTPPAPATASKVQPPKGTYNGPTNPKPLIRIPDVVGSWRADEVPDQYKQFVVDTVPEAATWYIGYSPSK